MEGDTMKAKLSAPSKKRWIVIAACVLVVICGIAACGKSSSSGSGASSAAANTKTVSFAGYEFTLPNSYQGPVTKSDGNMECYYPETSGKPPLLMVTKSSVTWNDSVATASFDALQKSMIGSTTNGQLVSSSDVTIAGNTGRTFQFTGVTNGYTLTYKCSAFYDPTGSQLVAFVFGQETSTKTDHLGEFDTIVSSIKAAPAGSTPTAATTSSSTAATTSSSTAATSSSAATTSATTYQSILDDYTAKLQDATPGLIDEYDAEAASNSDGLTGLATIANAKVSKLAAISTEGTEKMAKLMYKSGSGSYDEYSEWATKLQDVYTEEAQKIYDHYTDSAM